MLKIQSSLGFDLLISITISLCIVDQNELRSCAICKKDINDDSSSYVTLTEKGALCVCNASEESKDDLVGTAGDKVHRSCTDPYINKKNINLITERNYLLLLMALLIDTV